MPLQNKRTDTPGARANLIPGEIAHQRADDLLLARGDGNRKVEVDLARWRVDAAPAAGLYNAPLRRTETGLEWAGDLVPSSQVDGVIAVDAAHGGYGVPGLILTGATTPREVEAGQVLVETIRPVSDLVTLTELAFSVTSGVGVPARVGIVDDAGVVLFETAMTLAVGKNVSALNLPLSRGLYHVMLWCAGACIVTDRTALRIDQGLAFAERVPVFRRRRTGFGDMFAGLDYENLVMVDSTSAEPGEDHAVVLKWDVTT